MNQQAIKRWLMLGLLLGATLLLVWKAPKQDADTGVVLPKRVATQARSDIGASPSAFATEAQFRLVARQPSGDDVPDLFAPLATMKPKIASAPVRPVAPMPPPLPYTFVGKMVENGRAKAFLQEGEALRTVAEGDMLGANYKVLGIENNGVKVMYLPLNSQQTIRKGLDIPPARVTPENADDE